jgi:hypothetical protein
LEKFNAICTECGQACYDGTIAPFVVDGRIVQKCDSYWYRVQDDHSTKLICTDCATGRQTPAPRIRDTKFEDVDL